jgi:F0F1-type ATP synthase assembly protein I
MADVPPEKNEQNQNVWRQIARYTNMGFILPASIVVGLSIGALLDRWLKTRWITLVGLLVGCLAGFAELIREIVKSSKES